jgi:hypothetical protein
MAIAVSLIAVVLIFLFARSVLRDLSEREKRPAAAPTQSAKPSVDSSGTAGGLTQRPTPLQAEPGQVRHIEISDSNGGHTRRREVLRTLQIDYLGSSGQTRRVVHVVRVMASVRKLESFCELRQQMRTFFVDSILLAVDWDTGELIDLDLWVKQEGEKNRIKRSH